MKKKFCQPFIICLFSSLQTNDYSYGPFKLFQITITFYVSYYNFDTLKVTETCGTVAIPTFSEEQDDAGRERFQLLRDVELDSGVDSNVQEKMLVKGNKRVPGSPASILSAYSFLKKHYNLSDGKLQSVLSMQW